MLPAGFTKSLLINIFLIPHAEARKKKTSSAPSARFFGYFSRKGRKGAKDAKEEKRSLVCHLRLLITHYANLQNPFLLFPLRPLRLCERNYRINRAAGAGEWS